MLAGRDVSLVSSASRQENVQGSHSQLERVAGLYVGGRGGTVLASTGRDLSLGAAEVQSEGSATLLAGRDLKLGTQEENRQQQLFWDGANHRLDATRTEIGSVLRSQGELTLSAGQDIIARAAGVSSEQGRIEVLAGRDLVVVGVQANVTVDEAHQHKSNRNSAEAVNAYLNLTAGAQAPYMPGTVVLDVTSQPGQNLYIIENLTATGPGGWAGTRVYTDINEARRELALLPEWKNAFTEEGKMTDLVIREYTVKQPLPTRQGTVGPQEEYFKNSQGQTIQTGQTYPGGGKQVELLIDTRKDVDKPTAEWRKYLDRNPATTPWGISQR